MPKLNVITDIQDAAVREILSEGDARGGSAPVPPAQKRQAYREAVKRAGEPEAVTSVHDEIVNGPTGGIGVRIYRSELQGPVPIVVYLHGGAFISGDLHSHDPLCRSIANGVPCTVVAVDYRLAPEHRFPAGLQDCLTVLRWVAAEASRLGGAPSRIAVAGDSAGGNLAAVLGILARDGEAPAVAAQALIYPVLDATLQSESLIVNGLIPPFTLLDCVYMWQQYLPPGADRRSLTISPLQLARFDGLPPALVITAEFDILAGEGREYVRRLAEAGVAVEHAHYPDMVHGFLQWTGTVATARSAVARLAEYLRRV